MVRALLDVYYRLLRLILTLLMAAIIVPVTMQILSRYTGIIPRFIWTEEIARFCFVWIVMIGAMIAVRDGTHFDVDVLPHSTNPTVELVFKLIVNFAILLMGLAFLRWGYDFGILGSRQQSEIFGLPMITIYIAWPLAGLTWVVFIIERTFNDIAAWKAA
jgi:TRAP-type C4-dicarboxylate transport system permease small subunit